jgi:hypothetical protein
MKRIGRVYGGVAYIEVGGLSFPLAALYDMSALNLHITNQIRRGLPHE